MYIFYIIWKKKSCANVHLFANDGLRNVLKYWTVTVCSLQKSTKRGKEVLTVKWKHKCHQLSVWITVGFKIKSTSGQWMEAGLDYTELFLQIKIHVMQMSDIQYIRHRYICAVNFLNVDTCTASYCTSMHSTAFHRFKTGYYNLYRCWYGKMKRKVNRGSSFLRLAFLREMIFCNCTV